MNSKITLRLIIYFLIVIVLFSVVTGIIYIYAGQRNIEKMSINYTIDRAERLSKSIQSLLSDNEIMGQGNQNPDTADPESENGMELKEMKGRGRNNQSPMHAESGRMMGPRRNNTPGRPLIKWLNDLLLADIRIVDLKQELIEVGLDKKPVSFEELNEKEREVVKAASKGESKAFSTSSFLRT